MVSRKFIFCAVVVVFLFLASIPIAPVAPSCAKGAPSPCGFISNIALLAGGSVFLISELESRFFPGTKVLIELDNGEIKPGILTRKATGGRPVKEGDKVRLNCLKSYPSVENSKFKICELEFFGFDPYSACPKGSPCYGKIPNWSIAVDEQGNPDLGLIRFR
jgi:hypothetical protein